MIKCCKVIPFYFGHRRMHFKTPEDVLPLAEYVCNVEKSLDPGPGLSVDTILVNNSPECQVANDFFSKIDGTNNKTGKFVVMNGDNIGISFGAYNKAFEKFGDQYKFWAFTEDDIIVNQDNYLINGINQMQQNTNLGFVAFIGFNGAKHGLHAHGGIGMTSYDVLKKVYDKNGSLPHSKKPGNGPLPGNWNHQINEGEVPFTGILYSLGLGVDKIKCPSKPYVRWFSDHQSIDIEEWGEIGYVNIEQ